MIWDRCAVIEGEKFIKEHQTTLFKSNGAVMKGYVLVTYQAIRSFAIANEDDRAALQVQYDSQVSMFSANRDFINSKEFKML